MISGPLFAPPSGNDHPVTDAETSELIASKADTVENSRQASCGVGQLDSLIGHHSGGGVDVDHLAVDAETEQHRPRAASGIQNWLR